MFNEAVCTLGPPGAEDDVMMDESGSGPPVDLEEARGYLDEDDALQVRLRIGYILFNMLESFFGDSDGSMRQYRKLDMTVQ